ncbi:MAG: family 43 glycosylhydrolase, partial [Bacteroidota bacterium]
GTELGCTEGPHLYQKDGYYYLICAEGGTEYAHAVTFARSRNLLGPYETHPQNPILSAKDTPEAPLQKTGHADLVQDVDQNWWMVFLCGRPLTQRGRCPLGRETAIEEIQWEKGQWPLLKNGGKLARLEIPRDPVSIPTKEEKLADFHISRDELKLHFNSLRIPITSDWCDLESRPGYLRMRGQESLSSLHRQSLIARRVQHFEFEASTGLYFNPQDFQHLAGLICYYNSYHWYYLHLSANDRQQRTLQITACDKYQMQDLLGEGTLLHPRGQIQLKVIWKQDRLQFYYCQPGINWKAIGPELDASILSDDYIQDTENRYRAAFTGAFVGICCQDLSGLRRA